MNVVFSYRDYPPPRVGRVSRLVLPIAGEERVPVCLCLCVCAYVCKASTLFFNQVPVRVTVD